MAVCLMWTFLNIAFPQMTTVREREFETNMSTACGFNPDAPWTDHNDDAHNDDGVIITRMEEGEDFVPEHQPVDLDDEDECNEFVPTEAEKDAAQRMAELKSRPAAKAPKRPRSPRPEEDEVPDLAEIFDNYDTPHAIRISVCRAYASYLASMQPKKPKAAPKRTKK